MSHPQKIYLAYFIGGLLWGFFLGIILTKWTEKSSWFHRKGEEPKTIRQQDRERSVAVNGGEIHEIEAGSTPAH